ncbi:MAG TPA: PDZ domain-containing protein [Rhodothermales bacterium]|nr:PDZ domain-containing protein [Rhodothermales bacterium]
MSELSQNTKRVAFLAAAILALVFGALAALEAENRTYTGYRVSDGSRVLRVDHDSPGAAAGLRVGDVIKSLNGMPAANRKELQELQRRAPAAGAWRMEVERNGETVRLTISPTGLPAKEIRLARTRSLLGLFFLGFPFWAWFMSRDSPALLLAVFGLSFGFLLMGAPYFESPVVRSVLDGVAILALYMGMTALVHFLIAFPSRRPFLDRWWAPVVLYGPAVIVVLVSIGTLNLPFEIISRRLLGMLSTILGAAYFLSAIVLLVWRYVAASRAERARHGLGIMLVGTLAAFGPLVLYPVVTSLWPDSARYYQIFYSTYSPPLTLALIPVAFSVAAVRSARSKRAA